MIPSLFPKPSAAAGLAGLFGLAVAAALAGSGCSDFGEAGGVAPDGTPPVPGVPAIDRLLPGRTIVGDTLRIEGSGLVAAAGAAARGTASAVTFTAPGAEPVSGAVLAATETAISVLVPTALAGHPGATVRVIVGDVGSGSVDFSIAPREIRYATDLAPLLSANSCLACHGGSGGLDLGSVAEILAGGNHGPAAVPRDSEASLIVRVLRGPAAGVPRMPRDLPPLSGAEILLVADWVDQGARE